MAAHFDHSEIETETGSTLLTRGRPERQVGLEAHFGHFEIETEVVQNVRFDA